MGRDADCVVEGDHLAALEQVESLWRTHPKQVWIGWLTYDLGVGALLARKPRSGRLPGLCFRRFGSVTSGPPTPPTTIQSWPLMPLRARLTPAAYREKGRTAKAWIAAGETYQINLSQIFTASWQPWARALPLDQRILCLYMQIRARAPAAMGALIRTHSSWVVSNSPETLFDIRFGAGEGGGDLIRSWPIKGTRPRSPDINRDRALAAQLLASAKDRAEHVMIVDLVRNDLGRLAVAGSVATRAHPELMTLPTVHHLVTEVRATLRPGWSLGEVMAALFPGGSITGAPKHRTCELIDQLEQTGRGLYCGAIVVLEPGGVRCSIPIRTAQVNRHGLTLHSGGGIVADSDPELERLETLAKVRAFEASDGCGSAC